MFFRSENNPTVIDESLRSQLEQVSFATLGHYLEEGFIEPGIRRIVAGAGRVIGSAYTVRTTAMDSTALHHAVGHILPGQVLVLDTGGDRRHAPLGQVVAAQLAQRGAAGAVVDGVVTDIEEIAEAGLSVYARGTSLLTTKLHGIDAGGINIPISCGGSVVHPGDIVLADANGVIIVSLELIERAIQGALIDDAEEPGLIAEIRSGVPLGKLTGATDAIESFLVG